MAVADSINPSQRRKVGLALSSGVARGWAHIGAIRALSRLGIGFDIMAGCSAGALVGACYLTRQLDELESWALSLNKRKIFSYLDLHLGRGGLLSGNRIVTEIRRFLGSRRIEDLRIPFVAVATDLVTGHEIWLRQGDLADAVHASLALPGLLPPTEIESRLLADGALVDPLPVAACRALGADMVIAIKSQHRHHWQIAQHRGECSDRIWVRSANAYARHHQYLERRASDRANAWNFSAGERPTELVRRDVDVFRHHAGSPDAFTLGGRPA